MKTSSIRSSLSGLTLLYMTSLSWQESDEVSPIYTTGLAYKNIRLKIIRINNERCAIIQHGIL